jgi:hypothetical protein
MKVTLEKEDLIQILAEHFGSDFDVGNITIRSDPFEIEVRNVPLPASEKTVSVHVPEISVRERSVPVAVSQVSPDDVAVVSRRADADATVDPPPPGNDDNDVADVTGSPLSVVQQSRELEERLKRDKPAARRRGGLSTPPPYTSEES